MLTTDPTRRETFRLISPSILLPTLGPESADDIAPSEEMASATVDNASVRDDLKIGARMGWIVGAMGAVGLGGSGLAGAVKIVCH